MTPENEAKKEYLLQYRQMERRIERDMGGAAVDNEKKA